MPGQEREDSAVRCYYPGRHDGDGATVLDGNEMLGKEVLRLLDDIKKSGSRDVTQPKDLKREKAPFPFPKFQIPSGGDLVLA